MSTVADTVPIIKEGQTLHSSSAAYTIQQFIGEGSFGKVAKCQNLQTGETVAVKVLFKDPSLIQDAEHEVSILRTISESNQDNTNIVKFFEQFDFMDQTCLVFEMLEINLYDLFINNNWEPLHLREIRPIAKQLFVALAALKSVGILHTDIKTDNIMIVREQEEATRIKLIDFGLAIPKNKAQPGMMVQPVGYRAPEVSIGLQFTEAIDIWGVGCVLGFLFLAQNLFPVFCEYRMMKRMVEILGVPAEYLLWGGGFTQRFFALEETSFCNIWRLLTPEEYTQKNGVSVEEPDTSNILPSSLDDLMNVYPHVESGEREDAKAFVDLMKGLLQLDGSLRLTPHQALQHRFITMTHLSESEDFSDYFNKSQLKMTNCQNTALVTAPQDDLDSWHSLPLDGPANEHTNGENDTPSQSEWVDDLGFQDDHQTDRLSTQSWTESPGNWPSVEDDLTYDYDEYKEDDLTYEDDKHNEPDEADKTDDHDEADEANVTHVAEEVDRDDEATETALKDPPVNTNTSSGGLRKRLRRFFKALKRRALRCCCCCCLRPAED